MRDHYDFDRMKGEKNPYIKQIKQPITILLDKSTVAYFKALAPRAADGQRYCKFRVLLYNL
jgi:hypothetical protein